jgi:hypothetical protein
MVRTGHLQTMGGHGFHSHSAGNLAIDVTPNPIGDHEKTEFVQD